MRRVMTRRWPALWLIGVLVCVTLAAAACSADEQDAAGSLQTQAQSQQSQPQSTASAQPPASSAATSDDGQQQSQPQTAPQPAQQPDQQQQTAQPQAEAATSNAAQVEQDEQSALEQATASNGQEQPAQPQTAPQEAAPEDTRLIALFGDITEIVYALGVEHLLVARDASSIYPPEAEALPNLGFAGGLNAEAMLAFEPTLVIGSALAGPPGVLEQLKQAGIEVLIFEALMGLDAPQIKIRAIGEALGIPQRAEALAQDVEQRMQAVKIASANDNPLRVLHVYIRRGGLQLVSGQGNEAQTIIEAAGGIDAAAEAGIVGWQPLTPEALVKTDPDVYLVMDRGLSVVGGIEGLLEIPGMSETKAGRGRHIISMPDLYLLGFGPRLPEAVADLAQYLREIQDQTVAGG